MLNCAADTIPIQWILLEYCLASAFDVHPEQRTLPAYGGFLDGFLLAHIEG